MLIRAFALLVLLQVYATTIFAQPPELSGVVTANGDATASRFFAGASRIMANVMHWNLISMKQSISMSR